PVANVVFQGQRLIPFLGVHRQARPELLHVVEADALARLRPRLGKDRKQDRCQDGNDGNNDKQLDEGETPSCSPCGYHRCLPSKADPAAWPAFLPAALLIIPRLWGRLLPAAAVSLLNPQATLRLCRSASEVPYQLSGCGLRGADGEQPPPDPLVEQRRIRNHA